MNPKVALLARLPFAELVWKDLNAWWGVTFWMAFIGVVPLVSSANSWDPLMWRAQIFVSDKGNHTLILTAISAAYFLLLRSGVRPVLAAAGVVYVLAWHEVMWWVTDIVYLFPDALPPWWVFFGTLSAVCYGTLMFYPQLVGLLHQRFLIAGAAFYAFWLAIGFPVTTNFVQIAGLPRGWTQWYTVPWVNGFEVVSWLVFLGAFYLLERGSLQKITAKVNTY